MQCVPLKIAEHTKSKGLNHPCRAILDSDRGRPWSAGKIDGELTKNVFREEEKGQIMRK